MSTPVSLKKMEEAKAKAQQMKYKDGEILRPLSDNKAKRNFTTIREKDLIDFTDDDKAIYSRQYTNFEKKKEVKQWPEKKKVVLVSQEVIETPLGMATDEYIVDSRKLVCFNGKDHFLSALCPSTMSIDNHEYLSVEHYYQACKLYSLAGSDYALKLRNIKEPIMVKSAAKKILISLKVSNDKIEEWKASHGFIMLHHALVHKFVQNPVLQKRLVDTDDAILCQTYDRDTLYACGLDKEGMEKWAKDNEGTVISIPSELTVEHIKHIPLIGRGRNILGVMCMKIRKQIMSLKAEKITVTLDPFLPQIFNSLNIASSAAEEEDGEKIKGEQA